LCLQTGGCCVPAIRRNVGGNEIDDY